MTQIASPISLGGGTKCGGKGETDAATVHSRQAQRGQPRTLTRKEGRERQGRHLWVGRGNIWPPPKNGRYVKASNLPQGQGGLVEAIVAKKFLLASLA